MFKLFRKSHIPEKRPIKIIKDKFSNIKKIAIVIIKVRPNGIDIFLNNCLILFWFQASIGPKGEKKARSIAKGITVIL